MTSCASRGSAKRISPHLSSEPPRYITLVFKRTKKKMLTSSLSYKNQKYTYIYLLSNKLNSTLVIALRAAEAIFLQRMMFALKSTLLTLLLNLKETRAFHIILLFWHKYI